MKQIIDALEAARDMIKRMDHTFVNKSENLHRYDVPALLAKINAALAAAREQQPVAWPSAHDVAEKLHSLGWRSPLDAQWEHLTAWWEAFPQTYAAPPAPSVSEQQPVARVAEVYLSRYTLEWTNGSLPEGTLLYAAPPAQDAEDAAIDAARLGERKHG